MRSDFIKRALLALLTPVLCLGGCQNEEGNTYTKEELSTDTITLGPTSPDYSINATYTEQIHEIDAEMKVSFGNHTNEEMNEVYFNIWPNAENFEEGALDVNDVSTNGRSLNFHIDGTVLKVSELSLAAGQRMELDMEFIITIPEMKNRFGWSGQQVSLGNWFPILAVYDDHRWYTHSYFPYGESFYSITGNYDVTMEVPPDIKMLATGEREIIQRQDTVQYRFTAENVRDFAAVLHSQLSSLKKEVCGIEISVYYPADEKQQADSILESAAYSINTFTDWFGDYPWKTLDIVSVDYSKTFDGGMEYPQFVMINTPYIADEEELKLTVMHEVAHQWFYSLVGNDSYDEPWLDESLTTFASYAAFYHTTNFDWIEENAEDYSITSSVEDFEVGQIGRYGDIMYDGGAVMLSTLHNKLGDDVFFQGLRNYVGEKKFGVATTADFIRIMEETSGENLKPFFNAHGVFLEETKKRKK